MEWLAEGETVRVQYGDLYITNRRVTKVEESFSALNSASIRLEHLSSIKAHKKRRLGLVVAGVVLLVIFSFLLLSARGLFLYEASSIETSFIALDVLAFVLIILGLVLGPKRIIFQADSGEKLEHKLSNTAEIEQIFRFFGATSLQQ